MKIFRDNEIFNQQLHNTWNLSHSLSLYIYIYIYSHLQTDSFVVSLLFSEARYVRRLKLGSKHVQLYVRLSIIPLKQPANHVCLRIIRPYVVAYVCLHICLRGYQSSQFIQIDLHYASGSRKFLRQSTQPPSGSVYIVIHSFVVSQLFIYIYIYIYRYCFLLYHPFLCFPSFPLSLFWSRRYVSDV